MKEAGDLAIRLMAAPDISAGMRLRELAGWNQTEEDWRRFLEFEPDGCFVALQNGRVCGTAATLAYERRFGWVSMVLVDPDYRRLGIGTRLLERGIEYLEGSGVETVKLDATPMGRTVYTQRGFVDEYEIERWEGIAPSCESPGLKQISAQDLAGVCEHDRRIFGADRSRLLRSLWEENPRYSAVVYAAGGIAGYVFGRAGTKAHYLGPWIAEHADVAEKLLCEFLNRVAGEKVFVDACLVNPAARDLVEAAGFEFQRPLTRMYRGPNNYPGRPQRVCGIAGPELG